ncbi:MAG: LLM class F420-dependent oxidoreductase [Pseudomonadales bacterium]|nr:LLM class F420-dependent oxidoreductase [Pseudomonadales bacterium]MCP5185893.1 LLM class F420-dependent oxidoreductase [Pseudomonadales bacterium]
MKFGAVLPHNEIGTDPGAMKAYVQGLEALGASHLLIYDHVLGADPDRPGGFNGVYDKDTAFHEPLTTHAFIAAVTNSLELVTTVLILPQRQAALVAKQTAEVAILSNNRFRLGVGIGWNAVEYEALGVPFSNRGARLDEQVRLLKTLWREDSVTFNGHLHTVTLASINPRPSKPIPVWFGGSAPAALTRCAVLGDGWMPLMGPSDKAAECVTMLRETREAAGLNWASFGIQGQAQFAGGTPERWHGHASKWKALGATHLAVATHNAGPTNVDGHLERVKNYLEAVGDLA